MKIHLLDSDEPLHSGENIVAACGTEIEQASFAFMWDEQTMGTIMELNALRLCRTCRQLEYKRRYIYGLLPGRVEQGIEEAA